METSGTDLALNNAEAFAGIIMAATASDEELSPNEIQFMYVMFSRMRLFHDWPKDDYNNLFTRLHALLKEQGFSAFLDLCIQHLSEKLYQTAFAMSVDLVMSDGSVNSEEKDFLYDLQKKLGIETDLATKIIEVIILKNRG